MRGFFCRSISAVILVSLILLASCTSSASTAEEIFADVFEKCDSEGDIPDGVLYLSGSSEGKDSYLSESMVGVLYGSSAWEEIFPLAEDYAIYLSSFAVPFELAVFRCYSKSDTDTVGAMCLARGDGIKALINIGEFGESTRVKVMIKGRYVAMYVGTDPDVAERAFMESAG